MGALCSCVVAMPGVVISGVEKGGKELIPREVVYILFAYFDVMYVINPNSAEWCAFP